MESEPRQEKRIRGGTVLLGGLAYFVVRTLWSWRTWFSHQPGSAILVNILGLLLETAVFTVAFSLLQGLQERRKSRRRIPPSPH